MIISYPASPSRIIILLKTLRHIIENLKKKKMKERNAASEKTENAINKKGPKTFRCVVTFLVKVEKLAEENIKALLLKKVRNLSALNCCKWSVVS